MLNLRVQLLLSHLLLVIAMAVTVSYAVTGLFRSRDSIEGILQQDFREALAAQKMGAAVRDHQAALNLWVAGNRKEAAVATADAWALFRSAYSEAADAADTDSDREILANVYREAAIYSNRLESLAGSASSPRMGAAIAMEVLPPIRRLAALTERLFNENREEMVVTSEVARLDASDRAVRSIWLTVIALLLALGLGYRLVRLSLNPLAQLAKQAETIGAGDLESHVSLGRRDEIGALADSFNRMAAKLAEVRRSEVRRLQRAERMSDAALESLYDPVIVTDAKGRVFQLNRAAEGLFGPAASSPRVPVAEHIKDQRIVRAIENAVTEEAVSASEDERGIVPILVEGSERQFRLRASPMKDEEGHLLGSVVVLEDITHLRELDRLKNEFIGVASHELRTPVTSLLLSVQLMEELAVHELSPQQMELITAQKEDLHRLEKLMRDLLDITRLEAGSTPPRLELVGALDVVRSAVNPLKSVAKERGIHLDFEADPSLPKVRVDRGQIGRVLTNLLNNAIRHTRPGGKVVCRALQEGNQVTFAVEDTGEGIPADYLARIFDRFVQVPGATGGGAGLGLSIAQTIVKAHGGEMTVASELGKGSTFQFSLAAAAPAVGETQV